MPGIWITPLPTLAGNDHLMLMRHLPDNHWDYAESDEYRLARNALCNVMASNISEEVEDAPPLFDRLLIPLNARRIECAIIGRDIQAEINGDIGIRMQGYIRKGDGTFHNAATHCIAHCDPQETALFMNQIETDDQVAMITYAYTQRRDRLRQCVEEAKRHKARLPRSFTDRVFWLEKLYNRQIAYLMWGVT